MRELRLNPDNVHLGWNHLVIGAPNVDPGTPTSVFGVVGEPSYVGRLVFNPNPTTGEPRAPRYDLTNVYAFVGPTANQPFIKVDPDHPGQLRYDPRGAVGEFRGWTGDGRGLLGQCWWQQDNPDMCATDLATGVSRPLTADPAYIDPIDMSPDNKWVVALEARYGDRNWFLNGLPGVPPINDMSVGAAAASVANYKIGAFRLFQPYLLDRYPERPGYRGQRINECQGSETAATANSVCDANWGTRSDPRWSLDGTKIVFGQTLAQFPDCHTPVPSDQHGPVDGRGCPTYAGEAGNTFRLMVATLTDRTPRPVRHVEPLDDSTNLVPWGTKYEYGPDPSVTPPQAAPGVYTLKGRHSGKATVVIGNQLAAISTVYDNYSDDGRNFINGTESVTSAFLTATWNTALTLTDETGKVRGQRFTAPGGYTSTVVSGFTGYATYAGLMTTILDGKVYLPPPPAR
jgi:hypothetical protein